MQTSGSARYGFRIRTRSGAIVDNLMIMGNDKPDAERKLRQIYHGCEILDTKSLEAKTTRSGALSYEEVVDLISDPGGKGS